MNAIINPYKLNLQLFANANTNTTTSEDLAPEMKTFYDRVLLQNAQPKLVHEQFGQKKPIPAGSGKTIEFRRYNKLPKVTEALTEGVTPDGQTLSVETITATIAQYGGYVELTDMLDLTAIDDNVAEATKALGNQAGLTRDTIVRNEMAKTTSVSYCSKVVDGVETEVTSIGALTKDCKLTVKEIQKAVTKMKSNNIDPCEGGSYVAIIHPHVAFELKRDPEFVDWHKYTDAQSMYTGEIGKIDNVRFVESTEALITKDGSGGLAVYHTFVLGANGYGVTDVGGRGIETIVKQLGSSGSADPLNQRSTVGWKTNLTAEILSDEAILDVMSCTSYSDTAQAN